MTISPISPVGVKSSALKDEITAIWAQVQARVVQLGGGDVANLKPDLNIESVLDLLDRAQQQQEEKEEGLGDGRRAVRVAFDNTLRFVETVGGLVAGGAAEVSDTGSNVPFPLLYFLSLVDWVFIMLMFMV